MRWYKSVRTLLIMALMLTSFSACGGGTMGTGLTPTGFGMRSRGTNLSFVLSALVVNIHGKAIPHADVTVIGSGGTVLRSTDKQGRVRLPLMIRSGEFLDISVESAGRRYQSRQQLSPAGAQEIEQTLIIEQSGDLQFK